MVEETKKFQNIFLIGGNSASIRNSTRSFKQHSRNTYLIGTSHKDLALTRKLNLRSIIVIRDKEFIPSASPDYYIKNLSELFDINSQKVNTIMFNEIDISKCPLKNRLTKKEKLLLQNHFRRIQQHSIVMGKFMHLQARLLGGNPNDWEIAGILHDIDYARAYYEMNNHGTLSLPILTAHKINKDIVEAIINHTSQKFCQTRFLLGWSLHISEMFIKRFVHTFRKHHHRNISKVRFNEFIHVYDNGDFRKNERLTHLEKSPLPFDEFKNMMNNYDKDIDGFLLTRKQLFFLVKRAFISSNIYPLSITHKEEVKNLGLIKDQTI